jgi:hypothetical protein
MSGSIEPGRGAIRTLGPPMLLFVLCLLASAAFTIVLAQRSILYGYAVIFGFGLFPGPLIWLPYKSLYLRGMVLGLVIGAIAGVAATI